MESIVKRIGERFAKEFDVFVTLDGTEEEIEEALYKGFDEVSAENIHLIRYYHRNLEVEKRVIHTRYGDLIIVRDKLHMAAHKDRKK